MGFDEWVVVMVDWLWQWKTRSRRRRRGSRYGYDDGALVIASSPVTPITAPLVLPGVAHTCPPAVAVTASTTPLGGAGPRRLPLGCVERRKVGKRGGRAA